MKLYLVRHGIAVDIGEQGIRRDFDRPLSAEGRKKTAVAALGLAALKVKPDRLGTSPLVRARQTAGIFAGHLAPGLEIESCDALQPGGTVSGLVKWLRQGRGVAVMVFGHMPDLASLTAELIGAPANAGIEFKKAGVACVSFEKAPAPGAGTLEWLLQPGPLRNLAKSGRS